MTRRFKVIVCGSRDGVEESRLTRELDAILAEHRDALFVILGGCRGVDRLAGLWCEKRDVPCAVVNAPWSRRGGHAGPVRNGWMLDLGPDLVVAFHGGTGTDNMVRQAEERGVRVARVLP